MQNAEYQAEETWLRAYFSYVPLFDLEGAFENQMRHQDIGLQELLDLLQTGMVVYAEREVDRCTFIIVGSNCDEQEITVWGGFDSELQMVTLMKIEKTR